MMRRKAAARSAASAAAAESSAKRAYTAQHPTVKCVKTEQQLTDLWFRCAQTPENFWDAASPHFLYARAQRYDSRHSDRVRALVEKFNLDPNDSEIRCACCGKTILEHPQQQTERTASAAAPSEEKTTTTESSKTTEKATAADEATTTSKTTVATPPRRGLIRGAFRAAGKAVGLGLATCGFFIAAYVVCGVGLICCFIFFCLVIIVVEYVVNSANSARQYVVDTAGCARQAVSGYVNGKINDKLNRHLDAYLEENDMMIVKKKDHGKKR